MAQFRGTPQDVAYVWQSRKPLTIWGGRPIERGEKLIPTQEMIAAYGDLMVPVGESLRVAAPEAVVDPEPALSTPRSPGRPRREESAG